ncbi:MAG: argininosuccinate synthase [Dehalococcoidia bacterium]|nr:argininosuccinate synthase [Dehalococcoidia bacterium]
MPDPEYSIAIHIRTISSYCSVVGRKSAVSLYDHSLVTYDKGDVFDQSASPGFIHIWGLQTEIQVKLQSGDA